MVSDRNMADRLTQGVIVAVLVLLALSCLLPLVYTLAVSLSSKAAVAAGRVNLWPVGFTLYSYQEILKDSRFFQAVWVSVQRVVLATGFTLVSVLMAAYPLSREHTQFRQRTPVMWIMVFCMMFSGGLIPWYQNIKSLGLINNILALVLGGGFPVFYLILMINFFRNLPKELEEAALVDGVGPWRMLLRIFVPLSLPVLATVTLFTMVDHWNEFFSGLVLTTTMKNYPLQTYIQQLVVVVDTQALTPDQYKRMSQLSNQTLNAAKIFISLLPVLMVYPLLQRYFVSGITLGSVKE